MNDGGVSGGLESSGKVERANSSGRQCMNQVSQAPARSQNPRPLSKIDLNRP
jgi:hypothetical protein